jgi:hypothetical protein
VERAIAEIDPNPSRWGQGIPSPESAQTILAALDAVRWRDMATEPPTCDERCRILVIFKGERGEGKPVMLTYDPEEDPYFNKFEDSHFINTRYSPTDGEESYGLPVWQHNIDKWRPIVW